MHYKTILAVIKYGSYENFIIKALILFSYSIMIEEDRVVTG